MDVSALDSLLRADAPTSHQPRRSGDASGERFARLLDRPEQRPTRQDKPERTAKAERPERPDHAERQAHTAKNQRPERPERPDRAERSESPERNECPDGPERRERAERADRPEAAERPSHAAQTDKRVSPKADTRVPHDVVPHDVALADVAAIDPAPVDAIPIQETIEIAVADAAIDAAPAGTSDVPTTQPAAAASSELVKMSALALAHHVGLLLAQAQGGDAAEAVASGPAKAERAAAQPPVPAQGVAQAAAEAATAETFADFVLRTAANPAALAAAAAGDDDADAGTKTDAKTDAKGQLLVSVSQPMAMAAPVAPVAAIAVQAGAQKTATATDLAVAAETAAAAKDDPLKPTAKPSENAPLFAQSLERAQNAQAAAPAAEAKSRPIVVPPHEQVAVHIKKAVAEGQDRIVIRLNPVELGRIEIKLDVGQDGTLRASFAAERAQTLDALKNDSRQLERALQEAGLKPDAGGLNFSLRGDNRENAQAFADLGRESRGRRDGGAEDDTALPRDAAAPAAYRGARRSPGGLDLAV